MTAQCCPDERRSRRPAREFSRAAALLPGAVLVLLPKCPICLAAWLTGITGIAVPAAAVAHVPGLIGVWGIAVLVLTATAVWRRALRKSRIARPSRCL